MGHRFAPKGASNTHLDVSKCVFRNKINVNSRFSQASEFFVESAQAFDLAWVFADFRSNSEQGAC
jgi:hypothetical protein